MLPSLQQAKRHMYEMIGFILCLIKCPMFYANPALCQCLADPNVCLLLARHQADTGKWLKTLTRKD